MGYSLGLLVRVHIRVLVGALTVDLTGVFLLFPDCAAREANTIG